MPSPDVDDVVEDEFGNDVDGGDDDNGRIDRSPHTLRILYQGCFYFNQILGISNEIHIHSCICSAQPCSWFIHWPLALQPFPFIHLSIVGAVQLIFLFSQFPIFSFPAFSANAPWPGSIMSTSDGRSTGYLGNFIKTAKNFGRNADQHSSY